MAADLLQQMGQVKMNLKSNVAFGTSLFIACGESQSANHNIISGCQMVYPRVKALLPDNGYVTRQLNLLLPLYAKESVYSPISEGWIQDTESEELTRRYQQMTMQDGTYINVVKVVRDLALY